MKWWPAFLLILLFGSCTDSQKIPEDVIGKKKMEGILWDMLQADRYVSFYINTKKDSTVDKKKEAAIFYDRVFQMHGITRDEFVRSYKFYLSRPDITKVLFDSIASRAEKRRADVYKSRRNPFLERRDSIKKLDSIQEADSLRRADSTNAVDSTSTSEMSDSALRELLYK
jgi:hypothetical protein